MPTKEEAKLAALQNLSPQELIELAQQKQGAAIEVLRAERKELMKQVGELDNKLAKLTGQAQTAEPRKRNARMTANDKATMEGDIIKVLKAAGGPICVNDVDDTLCRSGWEYGLATTKRIVAGLVKSGAIDKHGQRRNTRYSV